MPSHRSSNTSENKGDPRNVSKPTKRFGTLLGDTVPAEQNNTLQLGIHCGSRVLRPGRSTSGSCGECPQPATRPSWCPSSSQAQVHVENYERNCGQRRASSTRMAKRHGSGVQTRAGASPTMNSHNLSYRPVGEFTAANAHKGRIHKYKHNEN